MTKRAWMVLLTVAMWSGSAAGYKVQVDVKNVSGEAKTNWPVVLRVYAVFGRNLSMRDLAHGFRIMDAAGKVVPHAREQIPPYNVLGNDEIIFVIPKIAAGQTLSYRIATAGSSLTRPTRIDVVASPHNLLSNGGFEKISGGAPAGFTAPAKADAKVKHGGRASLVLSADGKTVSTALAKKVPLHKGSWYYFGVWSKTDSVARFGYQANGGGYFNFTHRDAKTGKDAPAFSGRAMQQCSTRDWLKVTFEGGIDDWGMDRWCAQAVAGETSVQFLLRQRRHFYMEKGKTRGTWWLDDAVLMEQPEVTVRHDLALKPLMKDGMFVFTRPPSMPLGRIDEKKRGRKEWAGMPYAHERLVSLDRAAARGQRASFCIGVYHTREVTDVAVAAPLLSAGGAKVPPELVEFCPGYLGEGRGRYMQVLAEAGKACKPVTLAGDKGVRYFFVTYHVPAKAPAGKYAGKAELTVGGKVVQAAPITLRVQDLDLPSPKDVFVGLIYQGGNPRFDDEGMTVYARSGFNAVTRFGGFFSYSNDAKGNAQIDLDKFGERMMWLKKYGMEAVCVFTDFDLGPKWNGGTLLKRTRPADFNQRGDWGKRLASAADAYKAQIKRIEAARKAHPEWPELLYMTWDEPNLGGGRNGKPDPAMAWVNQVAPKAMTTLDVQFDPLPACLKWYQVPAFDDPANWAGPELYRWVKKQGRRFGYCGAADKDEGARSQPGMLMISTGATFFHAWHLTGGHIAGQVAYAGKPKRLLRAPAMINWSDGMNDLKAYTLLKEAMAKAPKGSKQYLAAKSYLDGVFKIFNGDHRDSWTLQPYLGAAFQWGYERFYDDWQEAMLRHAAAVKGVKWID